jgi:hypothetical protein
VFIFNEKTTMSKFRNSFKTAAPAKKPVVDISSNRDFPALPASKNTVSAPVWNCEKVTVISDGAKRYQNGDIFEGDDDENGLPFYGKLSFANGNVYEGPIRETWPEDVEDEDDEETVCESDSYYEEDDYYEEEYEEPPNNYGRMIRADGSVFWGVFCFGNRNKWN